MMYLVLIYAALVFLGGLMGFVKAGSLISLIVSSFLGGVLIRYGIGIGQNKPYSFEWAIGTMAAILVFFLVRFASTAKFMPAGLMIVVTLVVLGILWMMRAKDKMPVQ